MIKKLHAFMLKSYIGPLFMTFAIALFILLMQFLWKYIDELVGKGLAWSVIGELMAYAASGLVPMALPLAILLASLMLFGNLGEHYELTAMKSAGISLQKIMYSLVALSVIISIMAFLFSNFVLPYTNFKMNMLFYDIRHQRPELSIQAGVFNYDIDGYAIKATDKNQKTTMMYDILIYDHKTLGRGNTNVTHADSGLMYVTDDKKYMVINLFQGNTYQQMREKKRNINEYPFRRDKFEKQTIILQLAGFEFNRTDENLFRHNYQMMSLKQLRTSIDSLKLDYNSEINRVENTLRTVNYFKNARKYAIQTKQKKDTAKLKKQKGRRPRAFTRRFHPILKIVMLDSLPTASFIPMNLDSLFRVQRATTKIKVLDWATNYARASQSYLKDSGTRMERKFKELNRYKIAWHQKFSLSFACLIFFFIGAPLGAIIRKGGFGMPVVVSIFIFILYYIISLTGLKFAREGIIPVWEGMWASSFILLPMGIFLTYKATTDSGLLSKEAYMNFVKKIGRYFKFIKALNKK